VESICYFKADEKYPLVITSEEAFVIRTSIKDLAAQLDPDRFWQIHRGTMVNVGLIDSVSRSVTGRGVLKLKGRSECLSVSRPFCIFSNRCNIVYSTRFSFITSR
jgi:DNA-binding LytR/AlgR family response regulator